MNRYLIKLLIIIPCVFLSGKEISVHPEPGKGIYEKPFFPMDEYKENVALPDSLWGFSLGSKPASHDEIVTYFEYLDEVFSKVSAKSNLNAKFCFSVEKCEDNEFKLLKSARYAHSKEYIYRLSKKYKFSIESFEETEIRTESKISLTGYIFILKKSKSNV